MCFSRGTHRQGPLELSERAPPVLFGDKDPAQAAVSRERGTALRGGATQQIFRQLDFAVVSTRQSKQQRNAEIFRHRSVRLHEISPRLFCLTAAEVVFSDKQ